MSRYIKEANLGNEAKFSDPLIMFTYICYYKQITQQHFSVEDNLSKSLKLSLMGRFSADDILKSFSYLFQKTGFDIPCKISQKIGF